MKLYWSVKRMKENGLTAIAAMKRDPEEFPGMVTRQEIPDLMVLEARGEH